MPRDTSLQDDGLVMLPGNRVGRLCDADSAGEYRLQLRGTTRLEQLSDLGLLDQVQLESGQRLAHLFEASSLRPTLGSSLSPQVDGHGSGFALELLDSTQLRSWRRLGRLLAACPAYARADVEAVCFWDRQPQSLAGLRIGLRAVADALRRPRR
jgi:hypothetical protein